MHNSAADVAGVGDLQQPVRRRLVQSTLFPHRSQDNATEKEDKDGDQKPNEEEEYCASQGKKKRQRKPGAPKKVAVNGKEIPSKKVDDKDCPAIENPDLFLKASEVQNPQKKQQCVGSPEENDKTCSPLESPANMKMPRQLKRHANSTPKKKQMQQVQTTPKKKIMNGFPEQISDSPIQSGNTTQSIPDVLLEAKMKAEMGSPKQRHFNLENQPLNSHNSPPSQLIQNLLSAIQAPQVDQSSSLVVASKFQKIQTLYLSENGQAETSTNSSGKDNMQCVVSIEEEKEETCNGEIYLKCVLRTGEKQSEFDDLVDFVECKRGKDYSDWLKDRQRYRKWKCEKMAVLRWKKKKKTWKYMKERVVCSLND